MGAGGGGGGHLVAGRRRPASRRQCTGHGPRDPLRCHSQDDPGDNVNVKPAKYVRDYTFWLG